MAKTIRYPRKLRVKLEKIAADRECREAAPMPSNDFSPFKTFIHDFLPSGSAHMAHAVFDDMLGRLNTTWYLAKPARPERVVVPPPWEGKPKPGASK